jgi:integrase
MASVKKVGDYQWEARIRRKGFPTICKNFAYKEDAGDWAREQETAMKNGTWKDPRTQQHVDIVTLADALQKYADTESSKKKGEKQELVRLKKWQDHEIAKLPIGQVSGQHLAKHRDARRKENRAENTIRLELALLSRVFEVARKEWGLVGLRNPVRDITLPGGSRERDRRLSKSEEESLLAELDKVCRNEDIPAVVRFALATGMRQSEIIGKASTSAAPASPGLTWENINMKDSTAFLPDTKSPNGKVRNRTVPLFDPALNIVNALPRPIEGGKVFKVTQDGLIRAFADACKRAGIEDLHFHDMRHEFTSRLIETGWGMHEVMSITGHSTAEMLRRYTHLRATDLVAKAKKLG